MMHPPFDAVLAWSTAVLVLLCSFASVSQADVRFTEPTAGANLTAGQIDVRWEDSGVKPPISELTQYTLSLMVGGNDNQDMQPVSTFQSEGTFTAGDTAHGTIPEGIAADVPNGFFFRMTSTREEGGVLINYSDRFSIAGLTGDTALPIKQAAQALDGNTNGPPAVGNSASSSSSTMTSTSAPTSSTATSTTPSQDVPTISATSTPLPDDNNNDSDNDKDNNSDNADPQTHPSSISKGATAAIAVAATIATIAILAALTHWYLTHRRRRLNKTTVQEISPSGGSGTPFPDDNHNTPMHELSAENLLAPTTAGGPRRAWTQQTELSAETMIYEAGAGERPPELDCGVGFRAELEGDSPLTMTPMSSVTAFRAEEKGGVMVGTPVSPLSRV